MFELMKFRNIIIYFFCVVLIFSCKKDSFNTSHSAFVNFSADTIHFDTVFTGIGSITQSFKIFNLNNQQLHINKIELAGGENAAFKINVNGVSGNSFSDINLAANDSIYVFVTLNINPNQTNTPFLIRDSVLINYKGNSDFVQLDAYAWNARFVNNLIIKQDTAFTNDRPIVVSGTLTVNPFSTLTINKGTQIFCHQNTSIIIKGTLKVNGGKDSTSRVIFRNDRLDDPYKYYPGSWQGIVFTNSSIDNEINYASIENAKTGITISGNHNSSPQLMLNACIISNNSNDGLKALNSNINAENCLITNCGLNNLNLNAGTYNFNFCTVASYSYILLGHGAPVLFLSDTLSATMPSTLNANFINSIFYGEENAFDDEIFLLKKGNSFSATFDHVLYKSVNLSGNAYKNCIQNQDPGFENIDQENGVFDFHLSPESVCKDAGKPTSILTDLDGNPRTVGTAPDIGCYEIQ